MCIATYHLGILVHLDTFSSQLIKHKFTQSPLLLLQAIIIEFVKKKKQTRNALFLVMVRVREFTRAFFHIHHVLFAFNLWWKSEVLTTMLLLLLTTFWIASSRSNWFVAKMNILSFKSSSLLTFNKDVFCDFFNVRNCQDCSC